jgi:hypothetical protein
VRSAVCRSTASSLGGAFAQHGNFEQLIAISPATPAMPWNVCQVGFTPNSSQSIMGSSMALEATFASFQVSKENLNCAIPLPASSGTRTGPWHNDPQQT